MKNALLPLNVDLQIVEIHPAKYLRSVASSEADLFLYSWTGDFADPLAFLELFRGNSTLNDSNWKNEEFGCYVAFQAELIKGLCFDFYRNKWK